MNYNKNIYLKDRSFLPKALGNLFLLVCLYLVALMYAFSFTYVGVSVDGTCMENLYFDKDIVYYLPTDKVTYGDVVVFQFSPTKDYMKRIIAMEGDRINFDITQTEGGGKVYTLTINGKPLIEPYLKDQAGLYKTYYNMYEATESLLVTQPQRFDGEGERKDYIVPKGEFFALGDNRAVSIDSSIYGSFKTSAIKGRVEFHAHNEDTILFELLGQFFWPFN